MRYKKLLLAITLSGFTQLSNATYSDLNSMLQAFAPLAPTNSPEINQLIISLNALAPYPAVYNNALFTLVPLADGSLRAASDGPMRQVLSVITERLLTIDQGEETGYSAGDEVENKEPAKESSGVAASTEATQTAESSNATASTNTTQTAESNSTAASTDVTQTASVPKLPDLSQAEQVHGVWGQLLGDHLQQNVIGALPGYRADVVGGVIGRDLFLAPNFMIGVAGGYQHARVNQQDLSGSFLTINRYQGTVYGRYHLCDWPIYMVGAATLAANRYENSRYILVPPTAVTTGYSVIANSEFTGWEADLYLENGFILKCGNFRAVPKIMLMYSHLDPDSYIESDAFGLDLTVKYQDMDELMLGLGAKMDYRNRFQNAYVIPEAHVYVFHDFLHESETSTAILLGGGYAFLSEGVDPAPNSLEVGASLAVHSYKNTVVKIQYDYTVRSDYHRHGAFIKARYEWA